MLILGIDPGLKGALAVLDTANNKIELHDAPVVNIKNSRYEYDILKIVRILESTHVDICILEQSFAMPGQGGVSMFSIGKGFGMYQGILMALHIPFEIVHPKKWQKICGVMGGKISGKNKHAFIVASRLFQSAELITQRGRIIDGRVDALLLVEYGRRSHN